MIPQTNKHSLLTPHVYSHWYDVSWFFHNLDYTCTYIEQHNFVIVAFNAAFFLINSSHRRENTKTPQRERFRFQTQIETLDYFDKFNGKQTQTGARGIYIYGNEWTNESAEWCNWCWQCFPWLTANKWIRGFGKG